MGIYLVAFTLPYPLESGLSRPLLQFRWLTGPSLGPTLGLIAALVGLFVLYLAAIRTCEGLRPSPATFAVVAGFGALSAVSLVRMYPVFSLDVFYYMAADRIWSVWRENPFVVPPLQAAHDRFFPYTAWGHYPLPYGPIWPWITEATSKFGAGDVLQTLVAFKWLGALGYVLCLPLVAWTAAAFHPERTVVALCVFAWNPLVLLELVGGAHNDAVALVPAALAVGLWARRASIGAALSVVASFAVKATVGVLGPALLWASWARARHAGRLAPWAATHLLPPLAVYVLAWLPFAGGGLPPGFLREADQHYHSITALVVSALPSGARHLGLRVVQIALLGGFAVFYASQLRALTTESPPALRAMWRIIAVFFLAISPFFSAWYMVWPTLFAAILAERRTTVLNTLLCGGALATYLVQFVVRPIAMPPLSWAQVNALGLLAALGPFLIGWAWLHRARFALPCAGTLRPHARVRQLPGAEKQPRP